MPGGVQSRFLEVLASDQGLAARRTVLWAIVGVALAIPAWFLWPPWGVAVHGGGVLLGLLAGLQVSRRATQGYEDSIRGEWTHWMRFAMACETLPEIHHRVRGRSTRNALAWHAALLTLLWVVEVALLAIGIRDPPEAVWAIPLLVVNGLLLGALLGHALHRQRWYRGLRSSVTELVESGEIGVWGVL